MRCGICGAYRDPLLRNGGIVHRPGGPYLVAVFFCPECNWEICRKQYWHKAAA